MTRPGRVRGRAPHLGARTALLAPFFVLLVAVFLIPACYAIWLSFFSEDHPGLGFGGGRTIFVGLRNYLAVASDPSFTAGFGITALYCLFFIPIMVIGALVLALLLDSGLVYLRRVAQLGLFLPHAVPAIIGALIWLYLYTPGLSPIVKTLGRFHITVNLLGVHTVLPSIVNIGVWGIVGYNMVIFYAALQAVPGEVLEASTLDGAGRIRTAFSVKVPLIRASIVMVCMFTVIGALQLFTEPMLLHLATPMVSSRFTPNMYIFDAAFNRNNYGLASSASVLLLVLSCVLSYGVTRLTSRGRGAQ